MLFSAMIGVIVSFSHNRFQFQFDVSVSSRVGLVGGVEDLSVLVTLIRISGHTGCWWGRNTGDWA